MRSPMAQTNGAEMMKSATVARRQVMHEVLGAIALVAAGAGLRLGLQDLPNFAPVAALALFAGYALRNRTLAFAVPLAVMAISDWVIGGYQWHMMLLVYAMLALPVLMGPWLRRLFSFVGRPGRTAWIPAAGLVGCSLLSSILFFLVTNFGVWLSFDLYQPTWAGLLECYAAAIPFFRYTLAGDMTFAFVLFGGYALAMAFGSEPQAVAENA